jgi:hypothetical protein
VDKTDTLALTPPCCATLLDISVGFVDFRLRKCPPLLTISATDGLHWCILRSGVPDDATVLRRILLRRRNICRSANGSATIAQESIDDCHHSDPQHTAHLPLLCRGLHLSFVSPCTRPCSGATCAASLASIMACVRSFCLTHPEKLPILSAIMAVCSSSVIVFGIFRISKANAYVCIKLSCVGLSAPINWQRIRHGHFEKED